MRDLGRILEIVVRNSAPLPSVAELFFLTLPQAFTLTIPMGVLVGILIGLSRLAADSEITAMRASGIGSGQLRSHRRQLYPGGLGAGDGEQRLDRAPLGRRPGQAAGQAEEFAGLLRSAAAGLLRRLPQPGALRAGRSQRQQRRSRLAGRFSGRHHRSLRSQDHPGTERYRDQRGPGPDSHAPEQRPAAGNRPAQSGAERQSKDLPRPTSRFPYRPAVRSSASWFRWQPRRRASCSGARSIRRRRRRRGPACRRTIPR